MIESKFAAVNRHDLDAVVRHYSPDSVLEASDFCAERKGEIEVRRTYQAIFALAPEIKAQLQELVVKKDRVAARVLLKSDNEKLRFELPIINFFTVQDGKITHNVGMFDNRGVPPISRGTGPLEDG